MSKYKEEKPWPEDPCIRAELWAVARRLYKAITATQTT